MRTLILLILSMLFFKSAFAYNNEYFVRLHGMLGTTGLPKKFDDDKTYFFELGVGTEIGHKFEKWEIGLFSSYHAGDPGYIQLSEEETGVKVEGNGTIATVSYGPYFKYYTNLKLVDDWQTFFGAGPIFSLKSLKLNTYSVDDEEMYDHNNRINFTTIGAEVKMGIMENIKSKEVHPAYVQLTLGYHQIRKTFVIDASDYAKVEKVNTSDVYGDQIHVFYGFISFGVTVF